LRLDEAADQLNALELCVAQLRCDMARRRPTRWSFAAKCSRRPTKRAGALRCAITLCASTHRDMFHVQKFMCQIADQRAGALRPRQGRRPTGYALELCEYGSGKCRRPARSSDTGALRQVAAPQKSPTNSSWSFAMWPVVENRAGFAIETKDLLPRKVSVHCTADRAAASTREACPLDPGAARRFRAPPPGFAGGVPHATVAPDVS
jgi:hypothetical protein